MTSITKYACALALAGGLASPALAAQADAGSGQTKGAASDHIAQKLRADLTKAGYTDIVIIPSSFVVLAKTSEGGTVTMTISPDSVTALNEASQRSNSASDSQPMGASSNSAGATPGPSSTVGPQPVAPGGASKL